VLTRLGEGGDEVEVVLFHPPVPSPLYDDRLGVAYETKTVLYRVLVE
jgi:hypothetical protein